MTRLLSRRDRAARRAGVAASAAHRRAGPAAEPLAQRARVAGDRDAAPGRDGAVLPVHDHRPRGPGSAGSGDRVGRRPGPAGERRLPGRSRSSSPRPRRPTTGSSSRTPHERQRRDRLRRTASGRRGRSSAGRRHPSSARPADSKHTYLNAGVGALCRAAAGYQILGVAAFYPGTLPPEFGPEIAGRTFYSSATRPASGTAAAGARLLRGLAEPAAGGPAGPPAGRRTTASARSRSRPRRALRAGGPMRIAMIPSLPTCVPCAIVLRIRSSWCAFRDGWSCRPLRPARRCGGWPVAGRADRPGDERGSDLGRRRDARGLG